MTRYIVSDGSGLPPRAASREEVERAAEEYPDPASALRRVAAGDTLTDRFGFSFRRKFPRRSN